MYMLLHYLRIFFLRWGYYLRSLKIYINIQLIKLYENTLLDDIIKYFVG